MKATKEIPVPSVNQLEKRLDKLVGCDKPIDIGELESRLEGLQSGKRRKVNPLEKLIQILR